MRDQVMALVQRYLPGPFMPAGGGNFQTKCPFHKGGQERKPSFSINPDKALFQCFTCHVTGDLKYFLRLVGLSRDAIDRELGPLRETIEKNRAQHKFENENFFVYRDPFKADFVLPESLLAIYEWVPQPLVEKGFNQTLLQDMEIGYDRFNQRITYPLRDLYGNLAGISGGATQWTTLHAHQKYRVYQGGKKLHNGVWQKGDFGDWFDEQYPGYRCENHDFLWNFDRVFNRIEAMSDQDAIVYIVEGFKACLWMIQNGYPNTVALMGSYISERQQRMLHRLGCRVVLFLDNDRPGRKATIRVGDILWEPMYGKVLVAQYPEEDFMKSDSQPDDYTQDGVWWCIQNSRPFFDHRNNALRMDPLLREQIENPKRQKTQQEQRTH